MCIRDRKIAAAGKLLMYHNHNFEFQKLPASPDNGADKAKRMIEFLREGFSAEEMGFTLDTYWVAAAGGDVCQWIELLKDRIPCVHLKDMTVDGFAQQMAPVMEGKLNFPAIDVYKRQTWWIWMGVSGISPYRWNG